MSSSEEYLQSLSQPHITLYNDAISRFRTLIDYSDPFECEINPDNTLRLQITDFEIKKPVDETGKPVYPVTCHLTETTYSGQLTITCKWSLNRSRKGEVVLDAGRIPIMVKSNLCSLCDLNEEQAREKGENPNELGGFFIINGLDRIVRMLVMPRTNYPCAKQSKDGVQVNILSVRSDNYTSYCTVRLKDDADLYTFQYEGFYMSVQLAQVFVWLTNKKWTEVRDEFLLSGIDARDNSAAFGRITNHLCKARLKRDEELTPENSRAYLVNTLRTRIFAWKTKTDDEIIELFLRDCLVPHCTDIAEKLNYLRLMLIKAFWMCDQNEIDEESHDSTRMKEFFSGGTLIINLLRQSLRNFYKFTKTQFFLIMKRSQNPLEEDLMKAMKNRAAEAFGNIEKALATGSIVKKRTFYAPQDTGLAITLDRINRLRELSHYVAVHRGNRFMNTRSVQVRKAKPSEDWGFFCPLQTPDGLSCNLLYHLSSTAFLTTGVSERKKTNIVSFLHDRGMLPSESFYEGLWYTVLLDGIVIGYFNVEYKEILEVVKLLRKKKIKNKKIPNTLEIVLIEKSKEMPYFYGLYLFSNANRLMRPVRNLEMNAIENIGTFEQHFFNIALFTSTKSDAELLEDGYPYREISSQAIYSSIANLIPKMGLNPGARNTLACHMSKQAVGTVCHNPRYRNKNDTKMFQLVYPSRPLFKTEHYDELDLDSYPMYFNAIFAIVSSSGFDMEDGIVFNKSSVERGLGLAKLTKSISFHLQEGEYFVRKNSPTDEQKKLDVDGLPEPGTRLLPQDPICMYYNENDDCYYTNLYEEDFEAYVQDVRVWDSNVYGDRKSRKEMVVTQNVTITYRVNRPVCVGDKFSTRFGQKNICSMIVDESEMPYTSEGIVPDVMFNPHGLPSRMTMSLMVELMFGKVAAITGQTIDATSFKNRTDTENLLEIAGNLLEKNGYDRRGTETMYSPNTGEPVDGEVMIGVMCMQRLKHMVEDKYQVRSFGRTDFMTRQPVAGRQQGGAVRFGEMERDAIAGHGSVGILMDRMAYCSDGIKVLICAQCHNLLGTEARVNNKRELIEKNCRFCETGDHIVQTEVPYSFTSLSNHMMQFTENLTINNITPVDY